MIFWKKKCCTVYIKEAQATMFIFQWVRCSIPVCIWSILVGRVHTKIDDDLGWKGSVFSLFGVCFQGFLVICQVLSQNGIHMHSFNCQGVHIFGGRGGIFRFPYLWCLCNFHILLQLRYFCVGSNSKRNFAGLNAAAQEWRDHRFAHHAVPWRCGIEKMCHLRLHDLNMFLLQLKSCHWTLTDLKLWYGIVWWFYFGNTKKTQRYPKHVLLLCFAFGETSSQDSLGGVGNQRSRGIGSVSCPAASPVPIVLTMTFFL